MDFSKRKWLTIREAALYFNLKSPKTLYSLAARDRLPRGSVLRIGRQIRINIEVMEAEAGGQK
ncbi:hypothetical protein ES703_21930 [subsurface metagenome]